MMSPRLWAHRSALLFILLFPLSALPQQSNEQTPTFRAQTELVLVPVVVQDKSGEHIARLGPQDFELMEDGRAQKIATFEEVVSGPRPTKSAEKDQYTNSLPAGAERRLTILLLDQVNTPFLAQKDAREKLLKAIASSMRTDEPVALLALTRMGIRVLHDFTTDPAVLMAALRRANGELSGPATVDSQKLAEEVEQLEWLDLPIRTPWNILQEQSLIEETLQSFQDLAKAFEGLPGRKALIWVTAGFPFQLRTPMGGGRGTLGTSPCNSAQSSRMPVSNTDLYSSYEKTYRILNSANIALYSIDAREAFNRAYADATLGGASGFGCFLDQNHAENSNTMVNFAKETGGKSWVDASDFSRGFRAAMDDSRSYYLLGYYLNRGSAKPGWHKLKVRVAKNGANVRARAGFLIPDESATPAEGKDAIEVALLSPVNYTAIPMTLQLEAMGRAASPKQSFVLTIAGGGFTIDSAAQNHANLEVTVGLVNEKGEVRLGLQQTLDLHLKPESVAQIAAHGLVYRNAVEIPAGVHTARFVVRDRLSGRIGSVSAPLPAGGR
jgi:VWFA-related protein